MAKECPKCGNQNFNNAYQCSNCKHIFNDIIKCSKCGVYNLKGWKKCIQCHNELISFDNKPVIENIIVEDEKREEIQKDNNVILNINYDNISLQNIVHSIIKDRGISVLKDSKLCNALLQDYAKGELKKEIRLFIQILNIGCYKKLNASQEIDIEKLKMTRELTEDYFIDKSIANSIINLLVYIIKTSAQQDST
jgi:rRNA maturation protein Nop10